MADKEDSLYHYGVKGMKWGHRKNNFTSSMNTRRAQNRQLSAIKRKRRRADRFRSTLSDRELDSRIKRLEKEERLHNLTKNNVNRGRSEVSKVIKRVGTTLATTALLGAGTYALSTASGKVAERVPKLAGVMNSLTKKK